MVVVCLVDVGIEKVQGKMKGMSLYCLINGLGYRATLWACRIQAMNKWMPVYVICMERKRENKVFSTIKFKVLLIFDVIVSMTFL